MTVQVNFLPTEYRLKARRPRRLKLWFSLAGAMVVFHVVLAICLRWMAEDTRRTLQQAAKMQETQQTLVKEVGSLTAEKRGLARHIALAEQLHRKHRWSEALSAMTGHVPETVVITSLTTDPPRDAEPRKTAVQPGPVVLGPRPPAARDGKGATAQGLVIEGMAADHASVMTFLGVLNHRSRLGTFELQSANRQPFLEDDAVAFTVSTKW